MIFSRNGVNRLTIMVSNVLHMQEVRDIGLYDWGSNLSFDCFRSGMTVANFQMGGTSPRSHEVLINLKTLS